MLFTSDKAEIVTELHAWSDKNAEVMAKMMAGMKGDHKGHDHNSHEGHNH